MTVPSSDFLQSRRFPLNKLFGHLEQSFSYVSILGTDVVGKSFSVSSKVTSITDGQWCERGFVVRCYREGRYFEYAFNKMPTDDARVHDLAKRIIRKASLAGGEAFLYPEPLDESHVAIYREPLGKLPSEVGPDEIIARLSDMTKKMHELSPLVVEAQASFNYAKVSKLFLSPRKNIEQNYIWSGAHLWPTARRDGVTRHSYKGFAGLKGLELLDEMSEGIPSAVSNACKMLDAKPITPGEYDVICSPEAVGIIAHEAFGHGVELDMFLKNRANAREYMGKQVASPIVTMHDGAQAAQQVSSYKFDDEGNPGGDTVIIKNGILRAGISDALSAALLETPPTGNGKRETYANKAYSRMTNTFIAPGKDKLEDMIKSIKHGYLIEAAESGMEDPKDWGIQVMFSYAREIIDGEVTDNWVAPVVMTGYVPDLLKSVTMVSDTLELFGSGACGKGYKEWVKVSDGGPYIKAKARLG